MVTVTPEPDWTARLGETAQLLGVPVWTTHRDLYGVKFDLMFSCFYDRLIPGDLLAECNYPLNLHAAPLPKYRGVRPINWALKNGEREHGVTIHRMDIGIDDGPIYGRTKFSIWPEIEEVEDVYRRCLRYGWELFCDVIPRVKEITPERQDHSISSINFSKDNDLLGDRVGWHR